jgi:hypothetical protein
LGPDKDKEVGPANSVEEEKLADLPEEIPHPDKIPHSEKKPLP